MTNFAATIRRLSEESLPLSNLTIEIERIKQAAVTLLLREVALSTQLLIIKRAERFGDPWSGHLALPGGRADVEDANLLVTAARESWEEVGIALNIEEHFIGRLETLRPISSRLPQIEITPLIAVVPADVELQLNEEVAAAFWLPLDELLSAGLSEIYRLPFGETVLKYPAYPSPYGPIWGITERILTAFLGLLKGENQGGDLL